MKTELGRLYNLPSEQPDEVFTFNQTLYKVFKRDSFVELFQISKDSIQRLQMSFSNYVNFQALVKNYEEQKSTPVYN